VYGLKTEQMPNPFGIDVVKPRLSWKISSDNNNVIQTAYQILVASSAELLAKDNGDLWNSGKVNSDQSILVPYAGAKLKSNQRCFWKVKVFTTQGETLWSETASWSMGLLGEIAWKGQWVGLDKASPWDSETEASRLSARYLRTQFKLAKQVKQATVHICGLGLYELFINGHRVGDQVLAPAPTDFRKTVLYNSYDVTPFLETENSIGVTLGNGRFYTMRQNFKPYKIPNFGYPKLRLNLIVEYTDGTSETISSNDKWKLTADGPIRSNNEYNGEEYDARKELKGWTSVGYDDKNWQPAQRVSIPDGTLRAQMMPGMKVSQTLKPISVAKLRNKYIINTGQNLAGWIRFRIKGQAGDTIRLRYAEKLQPSGEIYTENLRSARSADTYIVSGNEAQGSTWAPRFVYHGFQYVEVDGYTNAKAEDFTVEVVEDEMEHTGSFSSSNETLNRIVQNAFWGIRSNYKGMPVDCPQRDERQPWLGDRTMGCWGESMLFDNQNFYTKWTRDIRDAQREDGCIPDVAPSYLNYYSDNVTWPSALPMSCDMLYTNYGDMEPIKISYPAIKRWIDHIRENYMASDYIITKDEYGDWCVPPESLEMIHSKDPARQTDGTLISTAYFLKVLQLMHRFASVQGLTDDAEEWEDFEHKMKDAFNARFLNIKKGTSLVPGHVLYPDSIFYGNNTVTANILPLAFGLVPKEYIDEVAKNVVATIVTINKGNISCGVIGIQWLLRELSRRGHADVAYLLATNKSYPSWGYMAEKGATTIWELWNGDTASPKMNSGNHVMLLGDLLPYCFNNLAGIRADRVKVGYRHIILKPDFDVQELSKVDASYNSVYGKIVSRWTKTPIQLEWEIEIPANTTAEVYLPDGRKEKIGSGKYHYSVNISTRNKAVLSDEFLYEKASFPECHGATIAETSKGDLVTAFFGGTKERNPDCEIWVCCKPKGTTAWTAPVKVADGVLSPIERKACWNPVLFQLPEGELMLFYKIGKDVADWKGYLIRSKDGGKSWSEPEQLPQGFIGPVKNKPEYINGRIICPSSTESGGWKIHFEISDDKGKTWRKIGPLEADKALLTIYQGKNTAENKDDVEAGEAVKDDKDQRVYAIQPSILKHKDGRLQVLARTRNGFLATSWSDDNGGTWSKVTLTDIPNNNSGTDAVTLKDGRFLLLYNDFRTVAGTPKGPRTPLNAAISDDGIHWRNVLTLEGSPISQYSYPSVIQGKDGAIHVVYTWRRQRIKYAKLAANIL
jgi:alpha-L-rhamnosidase